METSLLTAVKSLYFEFVGVICLNCRELLANPTVLYARTCASIRTGCKSVSTCFEKCIAIDASQDELSSTEGVSGSTFDLSLYGYYQSDSGVCVGGVELKLPLV